MHWQIAFHRAKFSEGRSFETQHHNPHHLKYVRTQSHDLCSVGSQTPESKVVSNMDCQSSSHNARGGSHKAKVFGLNGK
jgi:hypothetical protein